MVLAGYFLARCTGSKGHPPSKRYPPPPPQLGTNHWRRAYLGFYEALGEGYELERFSHSLKTCRDGFDGHIPNGRIGFHKKNLSQVAQAIVNQWSDKSDEELWLSISPMFDAETRDVPSGILDAIDAEDLSAQSNTTVRAEGGEKFVQSRRFERNPKLRRAAIKYHGLVCQVCGFDFQKKYGKLGECYIEVHHSQPLAGGKGKPVKTDPKTDMAVVCANCHRMLHHRKHYLLTLADLRAIIAKTSV